MTRRGRAALFLLAGAALVLGLLALGRFPQDALRTLLERRLGAAISGHATIGRLHVTPLRLSAELEDVVLQAPAWRLEAQRLRVVAARDVFSGRIVLDSLEITSPHVEVSPAKAAVAVTAATPPITIRHLRVTGGSVLYRDESLGGDLTIGAIEASGPVGDGPLSVRASLTWGRPKPVSIPALTATLEVSSTLDVRATALEAATAHSRLTLRGTLARAGAFAPDVTAEGDLDLIEAAAFVEGAELRGRLHVAAHLTGTADAPHLEATAAGRSLVIRGWPVDRATARIAGSHVEVAAQVADLDVRRIVREARIDTPVAGTVSGELTANGDIGGTLDTRASATALVTTSGLMFAVRGSATGRVRVDDRSIDLEWALTADSGADLHAEAAGRATGRNPPALDARIAATANLAPLVAGAKGRVTLAMQARGPLRKLSGSGHAELEGLAWKDVVVGPVAMRLALRDGASDLDFEAPEWRLSGRAGVPAGGPLTLSAALAETPLERFGAWLPAGIPRDRTLSGRTELSLTREGRRVSVAALTLETRGAALEASGSLGLEEPFALDLAVRLRTSLAELPVPEGWTVAGSLESDVQLTGSRGRPQLSGLLAADGVMLQGTSLPPLRFDALRLEIVRDSLVLSGVKASLADGSIALSGRVPLAPFLAPGGAPAPETTELQLEWSGIEAGTLLAQLRPESQAALHATLAGRAEIAGEIDALDSLRGHLELDAASVRIQDLSLELTPVTLALARGVLSTEGVVARTENGSFTVTGGLDLKGRSLDLVGRGALDLRAFSAFVGSASLAGITDLDVHVAGPFDAPRPSGTATLRDGSVRLRDIPEALSGLTARVVFDGERVRIEDAHAALGGGSVEATGGARLSGTSFEDVSLGITGRGMALRYPPGLRSRLDADLALTGHSGALRLAGELAVLRGVYDVDQASRATVVAAEPASSPLLRSIALDVRVRIENPILIRDDLAHLDIDGRLHFRGDLETPAPFGRLDIQSGGKLYVRGHDFAVERGQLTYDGTWNPAVSLLAARPILDLDSQNREEVFDVQLVAEGRLDSVRPALRTRHGKLSESQTAALVATGHNKGSASLNLGAQLAGEQAAALLIGKLGQSIGLDQVNVQPELIARDTEPGARFTFGKQLSSVVSLIYSLGLGGPEQRFVEIEARGPHALFFKGRRTDDGVYSAGAGQRLRFGAPPRPEPRRDSDRIRLAGVRFEGDRPLPENELRDVVRARAGKRVSAWAIQEDSDRLRLRLVDERFIEAQVGGRLEEEDAVFSVRAGPRFAWRVEGMQDPPELANAVRAALFEEEALENARRRILEVLASRGHLRARVGAKSLPEGETRTLQFVATPGRRLTASVSFPGATLFSESRLVQIAGGPAAILRAPEQAARAIQDAYRARQRLAASVGPIDVSDTEAGGVRIVAPLSEGPAARIAAVRFEGASRPEEELVRAAALGPGSPFTSEAVGAAIERLRGDYFALGYPSVRVSATPRASGADVDIAFEIAEGSRVEIGTVEIRGLGSTQESVVRRRLDLKRGDPLDPRRLAAAERRLLELGIFLGVAVTASDDSPATITVALTEDARLVGAYELRWSDSSSIASQATALVDGELRNIAGRGIRAGARHRVGGDVRETRGSLYVPSFGRASITLALFQLAEDLQATDPFTDEPITNVRTQRGALIQQALPLPGRWESFVGYRFKRAFSTVFSDPTDIASLDLSLAQDTRDNPLDARKGHFLSASFDFAPESLGSDIRFVKGFVQVFLNRPLTQAFSWAQAYRLGLAHPFGGQEIISSERFHAGGPNSVRGFATDALGPADVIGPTGGDAVLVFNQELRYRYSNRLGAGLFYDAGNVFASASDLAFDLRHALGAGLRWNSPVGLLRLDVGFPLGRREGEKAYRFHFALGQSF